MTDQQAEILEWIENILAAVSDDPVYRHFREEIGGHKVFIEDMVTELRFSTDIHKTIIDARRLRYTSIDPNDRNKVKFETWNERAADEMVPLLKNYYILELLANL